MTDNEIIKVLECCMQTENISCCAKCSLRDKDYCYSEVSKYALDLINRQKAEIERLQKHNSVVARKHYDDGIKEFAERLKENYCFTDRWGKIIPISTVDNLVKEMIEVEE